jgi:CheY-like chemotaxis protein/two-component sensor histidine kinase
MADVTSLKQAEQALLEADQRKDEFLAMLAHELRNPLVPIRNAAFILGRLHVNEPRVSWAHNIIERQVSHLTHLVDELLDVSRIARGKITLNKTRIELTDLIHQTCEAMQPVMEAKRHQFTIALPASEVILEGDLTRLIQVLQNLLDNAAKYTPDGGRIELTANLLNGELELIVRDNGMGISAELLPEIFKPFQQGERTLDRSQGGLGIGLTLVRRLVELHGGRVTAESPGSGRGASFHVCLPLAQTTPAPSTPTEQPSSDTASSLRVLVIDDDPLVAESMVVFLELEGHQVRSAESGETALRLLPTFAPQVILLDIGLPGQDGYSVARAIRSLPGGDALKLIAVSGYGHEEAKLRSRQAGFDEHLVKPVDPQRISRMLSEIATQLT